MSYYQSLKAEQITLGEFIKLLESEKPDNEVRFDFCGFVPTELRSYRGDYAQLALGYKPNPFPEAVKVKDLLENCRAAVGKEFCGYKGGDYTMTLNTPLWVAQYGDSSDTAIVGLADCSYMTTIATVHHDY